MKAATPAAYQLIHNGALALANVEANGLRVDTDFLNNTLETTKARLTTMRAKLRDSKIYSRWRKQFGSKTNLGSREQLAEILFNQMGYDPPELTNSGRFKSDEAALETVDHPFVRNYLKWCKLDKVYGTYLKGIRRETVNGFIHPFFNLHTARTFRSSSDSPNFQNMPVRNPKYAAMIRPCFIARENHVFVEVDYSGIEVSIAAAYHKDPAMISYICDPTKDMHRDMAAECFLCDPSDVTKPMRHCGKNQFVFPEFYGDYFVSCARQLWESVNRMDMEVDGRPLLHHLERKGIFSLGDSDSGKGTFCNHIKNVENSFWNERFQVYGQWRRDWFKQYLRDGGFSMLTGFRIDGRCKRNDVINYPVQGAAFHCLLWSLIEMNRVLLRKNKRSMIVGQIHDSIVADVHIDELDWFLKEVKNVMTVRLPAAWDWINVPLEVEAEVAPMGGSWHNKAVVAI